MQSSNLPVKFPTIFASSAGGSYTHQVPVASQIGITDGAASFTTGFPPLTFTPRGSGGVPPLGIDFNGLFQMITAWSQWFQAGGVVPYDSAFQTSIGGYPTGARVASASTAGVVWLSTVDNNMTNPDAAGAGWVLYTEQPSYVNSSSAGSLKIPGTPFIMKWRAGTTGIPGAGSDAFTGGYSDTTAFTWNTAFPNACFYSLPTYVLTANGQCTFGMIDANNTTGANVRTTSGQNNHGVPFVVFGFGW